METPPRAERTLGADPERVVVECCAGGTPAVLTFRDGAAGIRAVFSSFRNEHVELEMIDDLPAPVAAGAICHVSFLHRGRAVVFTAPVRATQRDADRSSVRLGVPARITSEGLRSAFRIPGGQPPLQVDVMGDDAITWTAELVNASLTGMFLRFPGAGPTLLPDQVVEISAKPGGEPVRLAGVVRRVESGGVGVFFPDAVSGAPENPVRRVVATLERDWHARLRR